MYNNNKFYPDYLAHYGVKGMKWGIRRYQNKDGTLTAEGRNRLYVDAKRILDTDRSKKLLQWDREDKTADRNAAGLRKVDDDVDVILKDSKTYRIANSNEPIDDKRKYVSITKEDKYTYGEMWDVLGVDYSKPVSEYLYQTKKDLKIASGEKVMNDILDKYGDKKLKDMYTDRKIIGTDDLSKFTDITYYKEKKVANNKQDQFAIDYSDKITKNLKEFSKNIMHEKLSEITDNYKKQGYDGIVDVEDWISGFADYPVILIDPRNSIKLVNEDRW